MPDFGAMPDFKGLKERRGVGALLLHHVKNVRIAAFHQGKRIAVVLECLSIPVRRAPHERDAPGRENKRVKPSQQGDGM